MSLAIDVDLVSEVLLADGWHTVADASFGIDSYEYLWYHGGQDREPMLVHGGGNSGICAAGFSFLEGITAKVTVSGPLTAVLAVRHH